MARLYEGRFGKGAAEGMSGFQDSIGFDRRLWREDIEGSRAHAAMLGATGIVPAAEAARIVEELGKIEADIDAGKLEVDLSEEDIHSFTEAELTRRLGDLGKKVHAGRSRNDQVALDMRLFARREVGALRADLAGLIGAILGKARGAETMVMPGYTHVQRAQPVSAAHHLLAWCEMLMRDHGRIGDCLARLDECPLGAGALAGTGFPLDREMVARELGFSRPTANSLDSVADRDYLLEAMAAMAVMAVHLSRIGEELVLWTSAEFGFAELDEAWSTGSSMMPQKKNADGAELVRGKAGRVIGDLVSLLVAMKGLPLAYNKDMQEDKEAFFDALDTSRGCLEALAGTVATMRFRPDRMRAAAGEGFLNATDLADYLAGKGLPFRDAHAVAAGLVRLCIAEGKKLEDLNIAELREASPLFGEDVYAYISLDACLERRAVAGGPAPARVRESMQRVARFLGDNGA